MDLLRNPVYYYIIEMCTKKLHRTTYKTFGGTNEKTDYNFFVIYYAFKRVFGLFN